MDILVALGNKEIKEKIDKKYGQRVYKYDISIKEDVLEFLKNTTRKYIVITTLNLLGNISNEEYIEKLRTLNSNNKIIVLVDNLTYQNKKMLLANEVFNIIEGNEIDIEVIFKLIEKDEKIIYKTIYINKEINKEKRKIVVFGTSGSGKSFISYFIATAIAKCTNEDVVLDTYDTQNPLADVISNLSSNDYNSNNFIKDILEDKHKIDNYILKDNKYKNLSYLIKNMEFITPSYENINFKNVINIVSNNYYFTIVDLPNFSLSSSISDMLYLATDIIFVLNPNYISLRQAKKYLEYISNILGIEKTKIKIVINNESDYSLDINQIKSALKEYKYVTKIKKFKELEAYINGIIYKIPFSYKEERKLLDFLDINYDKYKWKVLNKLRKVE